MLLPSPRNAGTIIRFRMCISAMASELETHLPDRATGESGVGGMKMLEQPYCYKVYDPVEKRSGLDYGRLHLNLLPCLLDFVAL